jgi:hypothetical protein
MPDTHENALEHTYSESHYRHTENRAQHKRASHHLISSSQQQKVYGIRCHRHRYYAVGSEIDKSSDTRHTSDHNLMRQD